MSILKLPGSLYCVCLSEEEEEEVEAGIKKLGSWPKEAFQTPCGRCNTPSIMAAARLLRYYRSPTINPSSHSEVECT